MIFFYYFVVKYLYLDDRFECVLALDVRKNFIRLRIFYVEVMLKGLL